MHKQLQQTQGNDHCKIVQRTIFKKVQSIIMTKPKFAESQDNFGARFHHFISSRKTVSFSMPKLLLILKILNVTGFEPKIILKLFISAKDVTLPVNQGIHSNLCWCYFITKQNYTYGQFHENVNPSGKMFFSPYKYIYIYIYIIHIYIYIYIYIYTHTHIYIYIYIYIYIIHIYIYIWLCR